MCLNCDVLRSKLSWQMCHNSNLIYSALRVDTICGPQISSLKQMLCFIRKEIRDTDHNYWKGFPTSFQVQTYGWSSSVLRNGNLFRICLSLDCIFFSALQMTFFFCFFILYPFSRYFVLLSITLPICGRNYSVMRRQCCRSASLQLLCTVQYIKRALSNTYFSQKAGAL